MSEAAEEQHEKSDEVQAVNGEAQHSESHGEELIYAVQATGGSDDAAVSEAIDYLNKLDAERRSLQRRVQQLETDKAFYKAKAASEGDIAVEKDRANLRRATAQALAIIDRLLRSGATSPRRVAKHVVGRRVVRPAGSPQTAGLAEELQKVHKLLYMATSSTPPRRIHLTGTQKAHEDNGKR